MASETVVDRAAAPDFSDPRVILVRHDDTRCARVWNDDQAGFEQACDGPTYLAIGRRATDASLERLSGDRFGQSLEALRAFRDAA